MDSTLVNQFFHWVSLYNNVHKNLMGDDREEAMAVIEDDEKFDRWLQDYDEQQKRKAKNPATGGKRLNKEETARRARTIGGEEG